MSCYVHIINVNKDDAQYYNLIKAKSTTDFVHLSWILNSSINIEIDNSDIGRKMIDYLDKNQIPKYQSKNADSIQYLKDAETYQALVKPFKSKLDEYNQSLFDLTLKNFDDFYTIITFED